MQYQEKTGLFVNVIPAKEEGEKDTHEIVTEYTFEYTNRNGHPIPSVTVAVVPFKTMPESALEIGIGWTFCSKRDNPNKAKGRAIAQARAIGAITNKKSTVIKTRNGREIGFISFAGAVNAAGLQAALGVTADRTIERIMQTVEHLVGQADPK